MLEMVRHGDVIYRELLMSSYVCFAVVVMNLSDDTIYKVPWVAGKLEACDDNFTRLS